MMTEIDTSDELDCALSYGTKVEEITLSNGSWITILSYKGKLYYLDEVEARGPFDNWDEVDEIIEKIETHVKNDANNKIVYHQKQSLTHVNIFTAKNKVK